METNRYLLSIIVDNEPGVLSRIAGLFSGRGFNIDSLSVAKTTDPNVSIITMVTYCDAQIIEQIKKQLQKYVERQLALIKVHAKSEKRAEIMRIVDIFRSKIVDVGHTHFVVEVSGDSGKIDAFIKLMQPMGIVEIATTGAIALGRENGKK